MLVQNAVVISTIGQELALKKRERKNSKKDCVIGLSVHMLRGKLLGDKTDSRWITYSDQQLILLWVNIKPLKKNDSLSKYEAC